MFRLVCVGVCVLAVYASAAVTHRLEEERTNEVDDGWWPNKQISMVQRMLNDCSSGDPFTVCLKAKAVTFIDRLLRKDSIQVMDGLSLVADSNTARGRSGRALTEEELVASLPRELGKKEDTLDEMIVSKISEFFGGHKVKLDFAEESDAAEPRKKEKKLMPYLMLGKLVAAGHLALALKGLALLAIKALFISKIALVLAGVIALKKLFSQGGGHKYEVITAEHHEGGHDRVYNAEQGYAQDLAYRGYPNKQQ